MKLHELTAPPRRTKKRVGRGLSAGQGKTAGRGTKGQRARTGFKLPRRFEGGQSPFIMRLPKKRGFRSVHPKPLTLSINRILKKLPTVTRLSPKILLEAGIISPAEKHHGLFKLVGTSQRLHALSWSRQIKVSAPLAAALKKLASQPTMKSETRSK